MKNYFFSYGGYGPCYTVMAENKEEAIDIVYNHIRKQYQTYKNKKQMLKMYNIYEYNEREVIETEYA
jgi:hypothetical protein